MSQDSNNGELVAQTTDLPNCGPDASADVIKQLLASEHGLRTSRKPNEATPSVESPPAIRKPLGRKPPTKKGKATKKKAVPSYMRSGTPSSRPIKPNTKGNSVTPMSTSSPPAEDVMSIDGSEEEGDADTDEDDQLYCICRKGDDHTWMIACDGGCKDWFHGRCVKIKEEDGNLIDRYICPKCEPKIGSVTTWKPMCRRDGCRKPARVLQKNPSKYCSDDCGVRFMEENIRVAGIRAREYAKEYPARVPDDSTNHVRGGPMGPLALQTVIQSVSTASQFRALGDDIETLSSAPSAAALLSIDEEAQMSQLASQKNDLRSKRLQLKAREQLLNLIKQRSAKLFAASEKNKEPCGYDERLGFGPKELDDYRESEEGKHVFGNNTLDAMPKVNGISTTAGGSNEDVEMTDAPSTTTIDPTIPKVDEPAKDAETAAVDGEDGPEKLEDIYVDSWMCGNKRCKKHIAWAYQKSQDIKFEMSSLAEQMREVDKKEAEIRKTALMRWRAGFGGGVLADVKKENGAVKTEAKEEDVQGEVVVKMEVDEAQGALALEA
jgi:COMPASS component SPP1